MFVNLKSLNESLSKKYIVEDVNLTEAFDESFPKWLKDRIVTVKTYHEPGGYGKVPYEQRPEYKNSRSGEDAYSSIKDKNLFQKALTKGIDFTKTKVVEGPIPEKRTDERLLEPNIPIWLFSNGQVYIEGINEDEIYKATGKAFSRLSMKEKIATAQAFAYIDGTTLDPHAYKDKLSQRDNMAKDMIKAAKENPSAGVFRKGDPEKFYPDMADSYYSRTLSRAESNGLLDKSGYPINPNRYKEALKKAGAKKIFQNLENVYERIIEVKDDIAAAASYIDPFEDRDSYRQLSNFMDDLTDTIREYNNISNELKQFSDKYNSSQMTKQDYEYWLIHYNDQIKNSSRFKNLKEMGNDIFLAGVDWLE